MKKNCATVLLGLLVAAGLFPAALAADASAESPQSPDVSAERVAVEELKEPRIRSFPNAGVYPESEALLREEGWVRLGMMIDPKGKPYEVTVVDSSGNPALENAALRAIQQASFEPARRGDTPIDSSFTFKMVFAGATPARATSANFVKAYQQFTRAIEAGDKDGARSRREQLKPQNLYDEALENIGKYQYDLRWGTPADQLKDLRMAIGGEKKPTYLPPETFTTALYALFRLEAQAGEYGNALQTWEVLQPFATPEMRKPLQSVVDQLRALQMSDEPIRQAGTIQDHSSWAGLLFRNRFSIAVKSGAVAEIKLRCEQRYLLFKYEPGVEYSIGTNKDRCGIEVIGDPHTTFELIQ